MHEVFLPYFFDLVLPCSLEEGEFSVQAYFFWECKKNKGSPSREKWGMEVVEVEGDCRGAVVEVAAEEEAGLPTPRNEKMPHLP